MRSMVHIPLERRRSTQQGGMDRSLGEKLPSRSTKRKTAKGEDEKERDRTEFKKILLVFLLLRSFFFSF